MFNVEDSSSGSEIVPLPTYSFAFSAPETEHSRHILKILNYHIFMPVTISFVPWFGEGLK